MPMPGGGMIVMARGPRDQSRSSLVVHWGNLPRETRLFLAFEAIDGPTRVLADPSGLAKLGIEVGRVGSDVLSAHRVNRCGERVNIDLAHAVTLLHHGKATSVELPGVRLPSDRSLAIVMNLIVPAHVVDRQHERTFQFDVFQRVGKRVLGGSTYQVRVKR
jgi:hypothetical protein